MRIPADLQVSAPRAPYWRGQYWNIGLLSCALALLLLLSLCSTSHASMATAGGKRRTLLAASLCMLSSAVTAQLQEGYVPDFLQEMEEEEAQRRQQSRRRQLRRQARPQQQSHRHLQANPEPPQLIWGYNPNPYDGPWPECEGKSGLECKEYIEAWTGSNPNVAVEQRGSTDTFVRIVPTFFNYDPSRVWIHCDHRDQVVAAPKIG